jgi:uncharacterized protein with von Willebrand factor type A (vWA) domain
MKGDRKSAEATPPDAPKAILGEGGSSRSVIEFCRFAHQGGLNSGIRGTIDSVRAAGIVDNAGPDAFRYALRSVLCSSKKEWDLFDKVFDAFWYGSRFEEKHESPNAGSSHGAPNRRGILFSLRSPGFRELKETGSEQRTSVGAAAIDRLAKIDFSRVSADDLAELDHLSERLLRKMSSRLSRRLRPFDSRRHVDLRRSARAAVANGGEMVKLRYRNKRKQAARLVILLDVSDSMNPYSLFLFRFAYALGRHFTRLACFVFSTRLVDVSKALKARSLPEAMRTLSSLVTSWSGGTKIAGALREFNFGYGRRIGSSNTAILILSDGWDTDGPEALVAELSILKQRAKKLIWLNPLLGLDQYEPVTRSMSAALPYIDLFAPAHNLQSLLELEQLLIQ